MPPDTHPVPDALGAMVASLLRDTDAVEPDRLGEWLDHHARRVGVRRLHLYLNDYDQRLLVPVHGGVGPAAATLDIAGTMAGRAFADARLLVADAEGGALLWAPVLDGSERVGVLGLEVARADDASRAAGETLARLAGLLVGSHGRYGDGFFRARRRRDMALAAEMQWHLLPPLAFRTARVSLAGVLEPAYEVGGDAFDYALNGDVAHLGIFDSMGHGLAASTLATVAVGTYRHSRREGADLDATLEAMDVTLARQFGGSAFATALLGQLDCVTGRLCLLNAGSPVPFLLRSGRAVRTLECPPAVPAGLGVEEVHPVEEDLEAGDRLLLFTDGVVETRGPIDRAFGAERLGDLLQRETAAGHGPAETLRRLSQAVLAHHGGHLHDDATMVMLEWCGG